MMNEECFSRKDWPLHCKLRFHKTIFSGSNIESKASVQKKKDIRPKGTLCDNFYICIKNQSAVSLHFKGNRVQKTGTLFTSCLDQHLYMLSIFIYFYVCVIFINLVFTYKQLTSQVTLYHKSNF